MPNYRDILSPDNLEKAIYKTCLAIEAQAVALCPVDKGQLRNSIMTVTENNTHGFNTKAKEKAPDSAIISSPGDYEGAVGTGLEYAAAVEFGRPDMPNYPAQPYLRPAAMIIKARQKGVPRDELNRVVKEYLNEIAARRAFSK